MIMAALIPSLFSSILQVLSLASTNSSRPSNLNSWCGRTPYPESCQYYINQKFNNFVVNQKSDFSNVVMQIALEQAIYANNVVAWGTKDTIENDAEQAALSDCSQLLDNTISRLNLAMKYPNCAFADKQTWLSMALANVETCTTGFNELGILDHPLVLLASNVSKSLSNALAVNSDAANEPSDGNGVPAWASNAYKTLLEVSATDPNVSFVVAQDGSGQGKTIQDAINAASKRTGTERFVIHVKAGTYKENVQINKRLKNIMIFGDGIGKTIITGDKRVGGSITTFQTATFGVAGGGFIARDITFRNTAGAAVGQAVALRSQSDFSAFYKCSFEGYQDTLYVHSGRQFFRECDIYGTVDFIFGDGTAVFQNCNIYARKPPGNTLTFTAQKRSDPKATTGIIIHNSKITASENLNGVKGYLGRPWGPYSKTVVMGSFLDSLIDPAGWLRWDTNANVNNIYYAEYNNKGPGSSTAKRVNWKGYHAITNAAEASKFTVRKFLSGESWLPSTSVPYTSGL